MSIEVKVPALGESVSTATIAAWRKSVGDAVQVDEVLVDLETEKVGMEVPSPVAGVIESITVAEGADVEIGALLCVIAEGAAAAKETTPKEAPPLKEAPKDAPAEAPQAAPAPSASKAAGASPAAAKLAREAGVDTAVLSGSGPKGHVLKEDIAKAASGAPAPSPAAPAKAPPQVFPQEPVYESLGERPEDPRGEERVRMSKLRKVVATRLKQAQNQAAILTTFNEVDMTALMDIRTQYRDQFEKKYNAKLGFMSFFVTAVACALQEVPAVNAEIYGDEIIYKNYYDIGIAVGSPQGLVVPVLRDAEQKSFAEIENAIADFAKRARDGTLTVAEMTGGTFTITNGGVYGSLLSTPIINPPQSGILGMHRIQKRPICKGDEIVAAPMMYLAHSYDHRIIDGRESVTFLVRVKELLEDPARLLLNS